MKINTKLRFSPFIHVSPSLPNTITAMIIVIIPQLVFLGIYKDFKALIVIATSVFASITAETIHNFIQKKITVGSLVSVLEGLIIGMFLPEVYPPLLAFFVAMSSLFVVKYCFGGLASTWANPAACTIIIAWFAGSLFFPDFQLSAEMLESSNPASMLFSSQIIPINKNASIVSTFLNNHILYHFGFVLPEGYTSLFWDTNALIPAFRFNLLTIFASIILASLSMIDLMIPVCYFTVYAVLVRIFSLEPFTGMMGQGDILLALLTSGTLFCGFFMLSWYGTTPMSIPGKIIYGILAGVSAFIMSGAGTSPTGAVFTVLLVNTISPVIQLFEDKCYNIYKTLTLKSRLENER